MKAQLFSLCCLFSLMSCGNKQQSVKTDVVNDHPITMIVGTYTDGGSYGMYSVRFDEEIGHYEVLDSVKMKNPSFVALSADKKHVYAVSELPDEKAAVAAFDFDPEKGSFKFLNQQFTKGADPCHLLVSDNFVVSANYTGGNISVFPIGKDGKLQPANQVIEFSGRGLDNERQRRPHLHNVYFSPDKEYLFANDLGTDAIHQFRVNNRPPYLKAVKDIKVAPGSGPRHATFSNDGRHLYLLDELRGYVHVFNYENGELDETQTVLADSVGARGGADIHMSPNGKFLYTSHRLYADGISIFAVDSVNGKLRKIGYQLTGKHPRNFNITPNGKYLLVANRDSNNIEVYLIKGKRGMLKPTQIRIPFSKPVCIAWV